MTEDHKAAIAEGRRQSEAVRRYLEQLEQPTGRAADPDVIEAKRARTEAAIAAETNPARRVELIQRRLDLETRLAAARAADQADHGEQAEAAFVEVAADYSSRNGISYKAWREAGVPAKVLKAAGIARS